MSQLSQQMAERDLTFLAEQPEVAEAENEATKSEEAEPGPPSLGSIGHEWGLCRRPCIYHLACGNCTKGADCALAEAC